MSTGIPWLARLRNLVREAVEQLPDRGDQSDRLAVVEPDTGRGPGWFQVRGRLTAAQIESVFDGWLRPPSGDQTFSHDVLDVDVRGDQVGVRAAVAVPAIPFDLHVRAASERRVLSGLVDGLDAVRESPLLADLAGKTLTPVPEPDPGLDAVPGWEELRPAQQRAVAACCAPGLQLIWGPPGTGRTQVVAAATGHLARTGHRVLVLSSTPVAVDAAVQRLAPVLRPGEVLRIGSVHQPGDGPDDDRANLRRLTRARQSALYQRAAELLTEIQGLTTATEVLERARAAVAGFDAAGYERANRRVKNRAAFERQQQDLHPAEAHVFAARNDQARQRRLLLSLACREAAEQERRLRSTLSTMDAELAVSGGRLWRRLSRPRALRRLRVAHRELTDQVARAGAVLSQAQAEAQRAGVTVDACGDRTRDEIEAGHHRAIGRLKAAEGRLDDVQRELTRLSALDLATPEDQAAVTDHWRLWELHVTMPARQEAAELEQRRRQSREREYTELRQRIVREGRAIEQQLVAEARVVATTPAQLALRPWITLTPFDHVIVDEAAAVPFPHLVNAVGRAQVGAVLIGDHRQNRPEVEPNFPDSVPIRNLFRTDCFAYFGATVPRAAQLRPGCVVLTEVFETTPALTELANRVAYGGVLEAVDEDPPTRPGEIVVITVDGLPAALRTIQHRAPTRSGWWAVGSLVARALAEAHPDGLAVVVPSRSQAAASAAVLTGSAASVGTAAAFQGRRFDTVLADLVEDGEGPVAGARLDDGRTEGLPFFTVAATRARRRLYLLLTERALQKADGGPLADLQQMITDGTAHRVDLGELLGHAPAASGLHAALAPYVRVADRPEEDAAVDEMLARIDAATSSVWCWNGWAGRPAVSVVEALERARRRGVDVHLIAQPTDQIEPANQSALAGLAQRLPHTVFLRDLHQKIVVTDREWSVVGSAGSWLPALSPQWRRFVIAVPGAAFAEQLLAQEMAGELAEHRHCRQCEQPLTECRETGREPHRRWMWICPNRHSTPFPETLGRRRTQA